MGRDPRERHRGRWITRTVPLPRLQWRQTDHSPPQLHIHRRCEGLLHQLFCGRIKRICSFYLYVAAPTSVYDFLVAPVWFEYALKSDVSPFLRHGETY